MMGLVYTNIWCDWQVVFAASGAGRREWLVNDGWGEISQADAVNGTYCKFAYEKLCVQRCCRLENHLHKLHHLGNHFWKCYLYIFTSIWNQTHSMSGQNSPSTAAQIGPKNQHDPPNAHISDMLSSSRWTYVVWLCLCVCVRAKCFLYVSVLFLRIQPKAMRRRDRRRRAPDSGPCAHVSRRSRRRHTTTTITAQGTYGVSAIWWSRCCAFSLIADDQIARVCCRLALWRCVNARLRGSPEVEREWYIGDSRLENLSNLI